MSIPMGIGTDIVEVARIKKAHERHGERFLERILTERERRYCGQYRVPWPHWAGRFAAKEAILKALGTGVSSGITWHDIEVVNNREGMPEVILSAKLQSSYPGIRFLVSISHCKEYATATALLVEG